MLVLIIVFSIGFLPDNTLAYQYSSSWDNLINTIANNVDSYCEKLSICRLIKLLKLTSQFNNSNSLFSSNKYQSKSITTDIQPRSYYSGAPAYYAPTFDPISILASLAFLAFLLQSFASLFDRSRSIIPAVISSRDASSQLIPFDNIMAALDEYDIFNSKEDKNIQGIQ